jgi:hypothetical protein
MNWRGRPLTSYEVMVELIGSTSTTTGLKVHAEHDTGSYPKGIEVSDAELAAVPLKPHKVPRRVELHNHPAVTPTQPSIYFVPNAKVPPGAPTNSALHAAPRACGRTTPAATQLGQSAA